MPTKGEQETVVTIDREDNVAHIYSNNPAHVRRMLKDDRLTVVDTGEDEISGLWGNFRSEPGDWNPVTGLKRKRNLSDEQRQAMADRLRTRREAGEDLDDEEDDDA